MYSSQETEHTPTMPTLDAARYGPAYMRELTRSALIERVGWLVAAILCAAYVAEFAHLTSFPLQDLPNHLARGRVIADELFHHGAEFGSTYALHLMLVPYLLHDLLLAFSIELFGVAGGAAVFVSAVLLSLPLALLFYMHVTRVAPQARLLVFLLSLYLSTDWFFIMGFMAFRLALAFLIVLAALAQLLRRRWSGGLFAGYLAALVLGYSLHLTVPVFFAAILGVSGLVRIGCRTSSVKRELLLLAPVLTILAVHVAAGWETHSAANPPSTDYEWGTWHAKLRYLDYEFERFGSRPAKPMMLMLLACLVWPVRRDLRERAWKKPDVLEHLAIAVVFLGLYFLMPESLADYAYVDVRALSVVTLAGLLACLYMPAPDSRGRAFMTLPVLGLAAVLAGVNLVYLARHVGRNDAALTAYRDVIASVPRGAAVLPVYTQTRQGDVRPFLHAGSFLVLDRDAVIPYLFGADRGDPMKYFRYQHRPYMPDESWYVDEVRWNAARELSYKVRGRTYRWRFKYSKDDMEWTMMELAPVDWSRVACDYDFVLATLPLDPTLVEIPLHQVAANRVATLLAVDKRACRPSRMSDLRLRTP
jgi:hypothetical protein